MSWPGLPLLVAVAGRPVILCGTGEAADAKRRLLERAGATVVDDHPDARLAVVAIEEEADALAAADALKRRGLLVNVVDRPGLCDWTTPAVVDRAPVLVAVMTGGASAGLAAALRQRLEAWLPAGTGTLADALFAARGAMREIYPDPVARRRALAAALAPGGDLDPFGTDPDVALWLGADELRERAISEQLHLRLASPDPDDLTLRQARALADADRVLHRADVPSAILARARADAARLAWDGGVVAPEPGLTILVEMS